MDVVDSLVVPDDAIITEDQTFQVLNIHDDVIITEEEVSLVGEVVDHSDVTEIEATSADEATMMAFVKFVQQPDGTLKPVGLVQAEEITDQGSILTEPSIVQTAEQFSRSALLPAADPAAAAAGPSGQGASPAATGRTPKRQPDMRKPHPCGLCGLRYKTQASLRTHQRLYHQDSEAVKTRDGLRCGEEGCDFTASQNKTFRSHLSQKHGIKMDIVKLIFKDWDEFESWRRDFEAETGSRYRQLQRRLSAGQVVHLQLACPGGAPTVYQRRLGWRKRRQRAGTLLQPADGEGEGEPGRRGRKSGAPVKARVGCSSFVRATRAELGGPVAVMVNTTHYGHTLRGDPTAAGRLKEPMPEANRLFLEEKLRAGWSLEQILAEARRAVLADPDPANALFRLHREHVYKVARRLGVPAERLRGARPPPPDEFAELRALADRLAATDEAYVLIHKEPGDVMEGVHESDFVFAFTTARQLELLHTHGAGVVMMDVTDAPRERPYRLASVYAFDGDGDAPLPVAWLLGSGAARELAQHLVISLREASVRLLGRDLPAPRYFVSEKSAGFHQTWAAASGRRPLRLLDQAKVRAALSPVLVKHVEDPAERQDVWRAVCLLITMTGLEEDPQADEVAARRAVYRAATALSRQLRSLTTTRRFGVYLEEKWLRRGQIEEWQSVFRKGVRVPSRCPAQVFHEAVAAEYLTGTDRRVDRAVEKLLEFGRRWHAPPPEKDASAPRTMAKFFPHVWPAPGGGDGGERRPPDGWGPPAGLRHELRLRMQGLVNRLERGLGEAALRVWQRHVHEMEEAVARA